MRCAIWYHLYNLKNVKNTNGGVLLLVKLQASITLFHGFFSRFLNCTNGTKSRNASNMFIWPANGITMGLTQDKRIPKILICIPPLRSSIDFSDAQTWTSLLIIWCLHALDIKIKDIKIYWSNKKYLPRYVWSLNCF